MFATFGNKVRIVDAPVTRDKGLAGKVGKITGHTVPSMMDFEIVGIPKDDLAIHVHFDDFYSGFWFDPDLLENIDDGEGTVITLDGVNKKWTKGKNGEWHEEDTTKSTQQTTLHPSTSTPRPRWWEFWK